MPPTPEEARRLAVAVSEDHPDLAALIFVDATTGMRRGDHSEPWRSDRVSGAFTALRNRQKLPHISFNDLRHFSATQLMRGDALESSAG